MPKAFSRGPAMTRGRALVEVGGGRCQVFHAALATLEEHLSDARIDEIGPDLCEAELNSRAAFVASVVQAPKTS